ncbi:MAG: bifunctional 2-C-methyl-D-erythritol 4-phosphate cytidylyltransferase/2-C-methyl-D-erythritol 2,4-cyclodiphosphate synthase [Rubellimicrobium sp.]|nr:bifunctional 2-C-methyl-D-erythritol 4-phosphate cytidylyltransferase/2-C-methyl-D-erythritol 2,4-cyclodiphosphate synthase [Rubellimicrobium sp.]
MRIAVIIVAAGRGSRAGGPVPKQWQMLAGRRVIDRTIAAFAGLGPVVVVLHPDDFGLLAPGPGIGSGIRLVAGAATREGSVRAGLEALAADPPDLVLIHDGARPLVQPALIARVIAAAARTGAAAPAVPVTDALWRGGEAVQGTVAREGLWRAQTPQGFAYGAILAAHRAHAGGAADDVAVAQAAGMTVAIVAGDEDNMKITGPGDLARAARILGEELDIRTGNGFDVHRLGAGDHVILCGVRIAHDAALIGHSDADVGLHALTDAILGALAEGDIGRHFPPSDPQWKGAASEIFLAHAVTLARGRGFTITHADVTLICERPKIGPHAGAMRAELARILGIDAGRVSVKATTSETLGFTGRGEGIAAMATATLVAP